MHFQKENILPVRYSCLGQTADRPGKVASVEEETRSEEKTFPRAVPQLSSLPLSLSLA